MPSPIIVYTARMFEAGGAEEPALASRIAAQLDELDVQEAFGPLACGGDILIAEAVLARGGHLNVVLPFAEDDFIAQSVLSGGEAWLPRYQRCRDSAVAHYSATAVAYVGDDNQFAYGTRFAMGLAALRARETGTEAVQIAVVQEGSGSLSKTGLAGTAADTAVWGRLGKRTIRVEAGPVGRNLCFPPRPAPIYDAERHMRSMIFADYKGFSALGERELPLFMREVMGRIGQVLDDFGFHVEFRNTWGDALYAVIDEPPVAARIALALQAKLVDLPPALSPPGVVAGMRIGIHYGPIFKASDRITRGPLWYGGEVNRTARIEPITPVGSVYCTEAFAAALILADDSECVPQRVGNVALAKDFGSFEIYELAGCG